MILNSNIKEVIMIKNLFLLVLSKNEVEKKYSFLKENGKMSVIINFVLSYCGILTDRFLFHFFQRSKRSFIRMQSM